MSKYVGFAALVEVPHAGRFTSKIVPSLQKDLGMLVAKAYSTVNFSTPVLQASDSMVSIHGSDIQVTAVSLPSETSADPCYILVRVIYGPFADRDSHEVDHGKCMLAGAFTTVALKTADSAFTPEVIADLREQLFDNAA